MKAKASGDKATADALKLVCNTTYGAMLNQYNDLYDALMARSVCISGQLYLIELANHLYTDIPDLKLVALNTDGIMVEFDDSQYQDVLAIVNEWQERTGFELEEDPPIVKLVQKDVNNYLEIQEGGKVKCKGGYLVKGISTAGAFKINNSCVIVAKALKEYFVNGTPVEDTINACTEIREFQIIAKAGAKFKEAYHLVDGVKMPVQKVNRVYATKDERYGKLYKVKEVEDDDEQTSKIQELPEHCVIDNNNELTIDVVDRDFYINMAKKRVNDFLGVKPEKKRRTNKVATTKAKTEKVENEKAEIDTKSLNVYQKLIRARKRFLDEGTAKSGKNIIIGYKYFELEDIVPRVTAIFEELGLIAITNFADIAEIHIVNTDDAMQTITFFAPFNQISPIISNAGKAVTNEMQALGSSITYMRRYLYMIALDMVESDSIEPMIGATAPSAPTTAPKAPATAEQRAEVTKELTGASEPATELQIKGLKAVLKKLREKDPANEDMITKISVQTEAFTKLNKTDCEALIEKLTAKLEEA